MSPEKHQMGQSIKDSTVKNEVLLSFVLKVLKMVLIW